MTGCVSSARPTPPTEGRAEWATLPSSVLGFKPGTVFDVPAAADRAADQPFGEVLERTMSPCPRCPRVLEAALVERGGDVYMRKHCPEHGPFDLFFARNAAFFARVREVVENPPAPASRRARFEEYGHEVRSVWLDLTNRCNMTCPNCFVDANDEEHREDWADLDRMYERLAAIPGRRPIVYLIGGEPTLRPELPAFVKRLVDAGFIPKLTTNGIRLGDLDYCRALRAAGLEWVYLQFDSFDEDTLIRLRNRPMLKVRRKAIENCQTVGFKVLLACMIERGQNDREVLDLLDYARRTPQVFTVSLLPSSRIGRNELTRAADKLTAVDVMDELDRRTGGAITREDFLAFSKILKRVHRWTKNPDYRPRSCLFHLAYYHDGERYVPLNRLLSPATLLRHWRVLPRVVWPLAKHLGRIDRIPYLPHLGFVVVEEFLDRQTIDLREASNCDKTYMTEDGYSLVCHFNATERV